MKIQLLHERFPYNVRKSYTVAFEQPTREQLEALERRFEQYSEAVIDLQVGTARMHVSEPKQVHWNKKKGRETALAKMAPMNLKLFSINKGPGHSYFELKTGTGRTVLLKLSAGRKTAFLEYFEMEDTYGKY